MPEPTEATGRHRWILVADSPFLPAQGGGEKENLGIVQAIARAGYLAALVIPTDADPEKYDRKDDLAGLRALVAPAPVLFIPRRRSLTAALVPWRPYVVGSRPPVPGLVHDLARLVPDATAVVITGYKPHHLGRTIADGLGLPSVIRMHNLEGHYHRALASAEHWPKSWALAVEAARVEVDERRLERAPWVSGLADISTTDRDVRAARARVPVKFVPTFALNTRPTATAEEEQVVPEPATVVFVGSLEVGTNTEALRWFSSQVWPKVVAQVPEARWQVVGRRPTEWVTEMVRLSPRTELHADVPDPGYYLRRATVAVNPAVSGSGVNIKLVEYLAVGAPVVSTTLGMQGVGLEPGEHLAVEDTAQGFADAVVGLLTDREEAREMGRRGQARAREILDVSRSVDQLVQLLGNVDRTGADRAGRRPGWRRVIRKGSTT